MKPRFAPAAAWGTSNPSWMDRGHRRPSWGKALSMPLVCLELIRPDGSRVARAEPTSGRVAPISGAPQARSLGSFTVQAAASAERHDLASLNRVENGQPIDAVAVLR